VKALGERKNKINKNIKKKMGLPRYSTYMSLLATARGGGAEILGEGDTSPSAVFELGSLAPEANSIPG